MTVIQRQTVTIPLSESISGDIVAKNTPLVGIGIPEITSCQFFVQGAFDTTSADFRRIIQADGAGDFAIDVADGSRMAIISEVAHVFPFLRIESSVSQEAARSIEIIFKLS